MESGKMLIRLAASDDKPAWLALSQEYDKCINDLELWYDGFDEYMDNKIRKNAAVIAVDRMSGRCNGLIAFSKAFNRITFFGISENADFAETANRLLTVALRQLNTNKDIAAILPEGVCPMLKKIISVCEKHGFVIANDEIIQGVNHHNLVRRATGEKRGRSFHYNYDNYDKKSQKEFCPACNAEPMPDGQIDIAELEYSWATAEYPGQGRLFGKMHILAKMHVVDFEEMPPDEMTGFMRDVQIVGKALHKVTGAVKINYEIHANSGPHIHIHLFPRYLDDDFPSAPIDYRLSEPAPYESYEEYLWFVEQMRKELNS
jgi:diadenosine tetraphosphate (Ap4A) HIT family hydrolase